MSQRSLALASYAAVMAGLIVGLVAALWTQALLADDVRANLVGGLHVVTELCLGAGATALLVLHFREPEVAAGATPGSYAPGCHARR
jgi:hypothetical protein